MLLYSLPGVYVLNVVPASVQGKLKEGYLVKSPDSHKHLQQIKVSCTGCQRSYFGSF